MIEELTLSSFRSLGSEVTLRLGRLVALVGPNGAGKSNVVDALRFVADAMRIGLPGAITARHGIDSVRRWSAGHPFNLAIGLRLKLAEGWAYYRFELTGARLDEYEVKSEEAEVLWHDQRSRFEVDHGSWVSGPEGLRPPLDRQGLALQLVGGDPRFAPLVEALQRMEIYSIYPDTLRKPQKYDPGKPMDRHGSNWASILKEQPEATWKPDLVEVLGRLTGDVEDVKIESAAGFLIAQFLHSSNATLKDGKRRRKWFGADQESDGTLRVAGIVTALLQQPPLPVIGIEEPELTVHPGALDLLYDYLREASRRSQVIVTTHSPELLDRFDTDEVLIVSREEGATRVAPMAEAQREVVRAGLLSLGEILRSEGLEPQLALPMNARE